MANTTSRLLIVEDEEKVARFLSQGLREEGYEVDVAPTYAAGRAQLEAPGRSYDLLLLDWMLPDGSGLKLAEDARELGQQVAVMMLTARDTVAERVEALNAGADDFLAKPFAFAELVARVRALLRRSRSQATHIRVQDLELDLVTRTVLRGGQPISLTTREFDVLVYLSRHAGRAVSRQELMKTVWAESGEQSITANVVDVQITRLRDKLERPGAAALIKTIRKVGYALATEAGG